MSKLMKVLDYKCTEFVADGNIIQRRDHGSHITWKVWRSDGWKPVSKKYQDKLEQAYKSEYNGSTT